MPLRESIPINMENTVAVCRNSLRREMNVVMGWVLGDDEYRYLVDGVRSEATAIHTFTLAPRLDVALANRGRRKLTEEERERIRVHYAMGVHDPAFGDVIDN